MFMINIIHNIFNGSNKADSQNSRCDNHISELKDNYSANNKKKFDAYNGVNCLKETRNKITSIEASSSSSSSNYKEYCKKTMLVADSCQHTKPTKYPIEIRARQCSSSSIRLLSPSQPVLSSSSKNSSTISLNNSLKKLPPISSFFCKTSSEKESQLLLSTTASSSSTSVSTLSPSFKPSSKIVDNEDLLLLQQQKKINKTTALIIPTFRSQQQISSTTISSNTKQSNELLRRLTQPNTIPPTIFHRIPNRDSASNDSLNLEMCYFKPIKPVPITPSKKGSPVIKRPLPKRIKPKRRKCDVFIGPKRGQMPIIFSTLTAFQRCSAFYSNCGRNTFDAQLEKPELEDFHNISKLKKSFKNQQQLNNFTLNESKQFENKFYLKTCYVFIKRSSIPSMNKSHIQYIKSLYQKQTGRVTKKRVSTRNACSKTNESDEKLLVDNLIECENIQKNKTIVGVRNRKNVRKNNVIVGKNKNTKKLNTIDNLEEIDILNDVVNSKRNTRTSNKKFTKTNKINSNTDPLDGKLKNSKLQSATAFKTKAAVKQIASESISPSPVNATKRVLRKRAVKETFSPNNIGKDLQNNNSTTKGNKKPKIEITNQRETRQRRQITESNKEKDALLKSDYEYALKLQMELELEVFPIEPVANRTRCSRSRMNVSCVESDYSSTTGAINQDHQQQFSQHDNYNNNNFLGINNDSVESNLTNLKGNKRKTKNDIVKMNDEEKFVELTKTGRNTLREESSKLLKRLFVALKH